MDRELRTERLRLRGWTAADRAPFAALNADPKVMEHFPALLSRHESDTLAERIEAHIVEHGWGLWAVEASGVTAFAGYVGLARVSFPAPFTPAIEVSWKLAAEFWGRGYATEAATAALSFGFQSLMLREIVSFTVPANLRSLAVMQRIGMTRDPQGDFEHPRLPEGHCLRRHVLFRKSRD